jgi:hypothetical protein
MEWIAKQPFGCWILVAPRQRNIVHHPEGRENGKKKSGGWILVQTGFIIEK